MFSYFSVHKIFLVEKNVFVFQVPSSLKYFCLTPSRPNLEHFYPSLQRHTSPANSVRELFKSSADSASLLASIKKILIHLG